MDFKFFCKAIVLSFSLLATAWAADDTIVLKDQHPTNYVVKKGDTLWDIASRFLRDPWRWPDIWYVNPQIQNPHLIYPGDEVVLTFKDGKPQLQLKRAGDTTELRTVKMSPDVRREPLSQAIPTIPIDAIQQFLTRPGVIGEKELDHAPYIVSSRDEHLVAGTNDRIYVRGLMPGETTRFSIYRPGTAYRQSKERGGALLGYAAVYVGEAVVRKFDDPSTLDITGAERETLVGDRIKASEATPLEYHFLPRAPKKIMDGQIIGVIDGVSHIGQYQTVVIDLGSADGIEKGHVLSVHQTGKKVRDTIPSSFAQEVTLPDELAGYLMVYRTFEKLSYALVMVAERDMSLYDQVKNP